MINRFDPAKHRARGLNWLMERAQKDHTLSAWELLVAMPDEFWDCRCKLCMATARAEAASLSRERKAAAANAAGKP